MSDEIKNKVNDSGIIQLDLETIAPMGECVLYDVKQNLWQELVLKEKDFRDFIKLNDWSIYNNKNVAIVCTADAIVPTWAFMLLTNALSTHANRVVAGSLETLQTLLWNDVFEKMDITSFHNARVIVKGCSAIPVPYAAFTLLTNRLTPVVKSLMFGEPCSTVPIYKA